MKKFVKEIKNIKSIFSLHPEIKLVYLFGSRAQDKAGPLSDYDFAIYLDEPDSLKRYNLRLELIDKLSRILASNKIDVCILNDLKSPELKYNIIKNGNLIYEKEPFKLLVEPRILNEYFDFHYLLAKYNLTKTL